MLALITFLQTLAVLAIIVCITYCLMQLGAYCILSLIEKLPFEPRDGPHGRKPNIPLHVAEDVRLGLGRTVSAFPILGEANHASFE